MPTYPVVCADRQDGKEYTVQIAATSPQDAITRAAKAGHITSRIDTGPPPAEHHASETDDILRQIHGELRAIRAEASSLRVESAANLNLCAAFCRRQKHISFSIALGVCLGMIGFGILVFVLTLPMSSIDAYRSSAGR